MDRDMVEACDPHTSKTWQDECSDCTTVSSASLGSPSSTSITEANDEVSTASESEIESVQDDECDDSEIEEKRHRRIPPLIFFGTPSQAEHEKRQKYATQARTRRLLRKDSLELNRRKSVGSDRGRRSIGGSGQETEGITKQEKAPDAGLAALVSDENDISALALSEGHCSCDEEGDFLGDANGGDCDSDTGDESSSGVSSEEGDGLAGDRTIRVQDALRGLQQGSQEEQPPSTPTKQIMRPYLSRPSLAPSDADSSPGIALSLHPSSANRPSPFYRPSPASGSKVNHRASPSAENAPPMSSLDFNAGLLELEKDHRIAHSISPRKSILQESPSRVNQAISPYKATHTPSPTKVVVRQTLSAWAHAKLKTPQSPEKIEWEKKHAVAVSPSRTCNASSSISSSVKEDATEPTFPSTSTAAQNHQSINAMKPVTMTKVERPILSSMLGKVGQGQLIWQPSRIARPVPASRLPKPVQRPPTDSVAPAGTAAKRMITSNAAPTFRRIAAPSSSSALRPASANGSFHVFAASKSATRAPPFSSGPFRAPSKQLKSSDCSSAVRSTASLSSSPAKVAPSPLYQRSTSNSSPPFKRLAAVSTPVVVRDARLFAASRAMSGAPSEASSSSSSSSSSPAMMTVHLPSTLNSSSPASIPAQVSVGVGAARRVAISRETTQPSDGFRHRATQKVERVHDERRGLRIKEITMGKSLANERSASSEGQDVVPSNATSTEKIAVADVLDVERQESKADVPRSSRRKHEKQSTAKSSKTHKSSSVLSSSSNDKIGGMMPLSKTELSRLTSLHTQRNEQFVSQMEVIMVRKVGELRPSSPSSKIRKSVASTGAGSSAISAEAAREARKQRARKRTPDAFQGEEEEQEMSSINNQKYLHQLGAGEDVPYTSPPRSTSQHHRVRWLKDLFCGPNEAKPAPLPTAAHIRGCLRNKGLFLDSLGNACDAAQPLSPRLTKNRVTVYKLIYDDDEQ